MHVSLSLIFSYFFFLSLFSFSHAVFLSYHVFASHTVYYTKSFTDSITAAFTEAFVLAYALFQVCELFLKRFRFVDGDDLIDPNMRHITWRRLHGFNNYMTEKQASDYKLMVLYRHYDWLVEQEAFGPAKKYFELRGFSSWSKTPAKFSDIRFYFSRSEAVEISKRGIEQRAHEEAKAEHARIAKVSPLPAIVAENPDSIVSTLD